MSFVADTTIRFFYALYLVLAFVCTTLDRLVNFIDVVTTYLNWVTLKQLAHLGQERIELSKLLLLHHEKGVLSLVLHLPVYHFEKFNQLLVRLLC
jgi:hypothetical protein